MAGRHEHCTARILQIAEDHGVIALDLENTVRSATPASSLATLVTLGVHSGGVHYAVVEAQPWPLLRTICQHACTFLVWDAGCERTWLEVHQIPLESVKIVDVQPHFKRRSTFDGPWLRESDGFVMDGGLNRTIHEAFALGRAPGERLFLKAPDSNAFFFPNGHPAPSIWAARPLRVEHIEYAVADVVSLHILWTRHQLPE